MEENDLNNELKYKKICRFCLKQSGLLGSIYVRDARMKASAPLPLQIMAIASIEVFSNDGMPSYVCDDCRLHFEYCYRFKQMCKRADTLLRQYPLVGKWPQPLSKPSVPNELLKNKAKIISQEIIVSPIISFEETKNRDSTLTPTSPSKAKNSVSTKQEQPPKKLLNATPADVPEPPVPKRMKIEKSDDIENASTIFFNKVENNEELSMNDVQLLIEAVEKDDELIMLNSEENNIKTAGTNNTSRPVPNQPKLLNKSSKRILNKEANFTYEPRLSKPQIKRDEDGNVEIITEILDPNEPYEPEPDPLKSAPQVETNVFPCPYCVRSFPLKQLLDIHVVNHTRERNHQCSECDKSFFSKYDLQKHIVIHTGEKPYQCSVCDKAFTRSALLYRHEKTHTDIPKFICIYCEKPFICKNELAKHTERHLKHRPFECKICKKSFAFKQGLERHEMTHSNDKPFNCHYCEMSFFTAGKLARHLTAHAGKRAYPCKYCNKSFILSHHLTRHLRSHTHIMSSFDCNECKLKCSTMEEFLKHSAEHAAVTTICPLCKQQLDDQNIIDNHFQEHAKTAYACEFCDLIYITAESLQNHTTADHSDEMMAYQVHDGKTETKRTQRSKIETTNDDNEQIDLNEMGIYLDDILVDDVLLFNEQEQQQENTVIKETIKIEPATIEEQLQHQKEQRKQHQQKHAQVSEVPTKTRQICQTTGLQNVKHIVVATANRAPKMNSPPLRRKVPIASNVLTKPAALSKVKIEKEEIIMPELKRVQTIDGNGVTRVLKALPKSVTVRRNTPASTSQTTQPKVKNDNTIPPTNAKTLPAKDAALSPVEQSTQQRRTLRVVKKSPQTTNSTSIIAKTAISPNSSNEKITVIGGKTVKVQRLALTNEKSDEFARKVRPKINNNNASISKTSQ